MEQQRSAKDEGRPMPHSYQILTRIRQRLEEMADSQEQISSARKRLLVKRERVRTASRVVQLKRVDAGDAEVAFMSRLREFVNTNPETLPAPLFEAYHKVQETRDDLGETEENYLGAESDLTGAEWNFMDQEDRFYQWDIHSILPEESSDNTTPPYTVRSEDMSHLSALDTPPCPTGSPFPSEFSELPPQSPPPPSPPQGFSVSHGPVDTSPLVEVERGYAAMMARVNTLKREFDQLRQMRAGNIQWNDSHEPSLHEDDRLFDTDPTDSTNEHGDIVLDISIHEAIAQQFKVEEMTPTLGASILTRRHSDTVDALRRAPTPSNLMRRTQTESAASSKHDNPVVKQKICEWSLVNLQESAVQKQLYFNTLHDHGIGSPTKGDWKTQAIESWSDDSLIERGEGSEHDASSVNGTGYEPGSCHELSVTQSATSSPTMKYLQEDDPPATDHLIAVSEPHGSYEILPEDRHTSTLSVTPPRQIADTIKINDGNQITQSAIEMTERRHEAKNETTKNTFSTLAPCTCITGIEDTTQRKDSVQTTSVASHHDSEMAASKHDHGPKAHYSTQEQNDVEAKPGTITFDEPCNQPPQVESVDLDLPHSSGSSWGNSTYAILDSNKLAQSAPSSACAQPETSPALIDKAKQQPPECLVTPAFRPIPPGRRRTTGWLRNLFPLAKRNRSNRASSTGGYQSLTRY